MQRHFERKKVGFVVQHVKGGFLTGFGKLFGSPALGSTIVPIGKATLTLEKLLKEPTIHEVLDVIKFYSNL